MRDRSFGQIFSRNLIEQGFIKATLLASLTKHQSALVQEQALVEVENLHQTALGLEQIPVEVENPGQTEVPQQLEKAAVALKTVEQPKEQVPNRGATVVSSPIVQLVVKPSPQLPQAVTKEPAKTKSSLNLASTQVLNAAPQGVQLSLFDIGFGLSTSSELKSVPQNTALVEKVPAFSTSPASEPNQSVKETVVAPLLEAIPINKEPYRTHLGSISN